MTATKQTIERDGLTYNFSEVEKKTEHLPLFTRLEMLAHNPSHIDYGRKVVLSVLPMGGVVRYCRIEGDTWSTSFNVEEEGFFSDVKVAREWIEKLRDFDADMNTKFEQD